MRNRDNGREIIEKLCADTWRELYGFIYYRVQNREEAEDITQETYAKAISYLHRNDVDILECRSYLKTIAMNIIRDQWRAKKRRGSSVNIEELKPEETALEDFTDSLSDRDQIEGAIRVLQLRAVKALARMLATELDKEER
ncbi:sigma factor [Lachnospiraceae bacterium 54-53]